MASADVQAPPPLEERSPKPRRTTRDDDDEPARPPTAPRQQGADRYRPVHRPKKERTPPPEPTAEQKQAAAKAEYEKLLSARSGGVYIPPARLRALQAQITDHTSKEFQRMAWEALKKSLQGLVNKANTANIRQIVPELFGENLIRGRGLLAQSLIKAQAASLPFTPIYAALVAVINSKIPTLGELLLRRLVLRFRKGYKRNDKAVCLSATTFLAHLVNQQVAHEMVAAQILLLLLKKPTDDSVEIAVNFTREVGQFLDEMNPAIANVVFDQFRNILHEAPIDKRTQYMIEVLFQARKDKFKDNTAVKEELDLVEEEDQIKHFVELDGDIDPQDTLNIFRYDAEWEENEASYKKLKGEILGEGSDYDDDDDSDDDSSDGEDEEQKAIEIKDQSNADLVNLRKTIYLTIQSSLDAEEAVHKLMKINLPAGQEPELPSMVVECCSQEKTYTKFYGLIGERFSKINRLWTDLFSDSFTKYYETIHRYDNNKLRSIARFFGHLFATDSISWHAMSAIHLNEEETTSASRIFIKIMFQEVAEQMGMPKLQARMRDETLQPSLESIFPRDSARNVRFSINYFTSIGMGALTEDMRTFLQNMPKPALPAPPKADESESDSDSRSSYSSYTGSSYSSRSRSRSRSYARRDDGARGRSPSRTPPRRGGGGGRDLPRRSRDRSSTRSISTSRSRSRSPPRRDVAPARGRSYSRSPPRRHQYRDRSYSSRSRSRGSTRSISTRRSRSRSPPPRKAARGLSRSRSPPSRREQARSRDSRSLSPPPRRRQPDRGRRSASSRSRSLSRSASPPPAASRRRRRNSSSSVSSAPRRKYRRSS